MTNGYSPPSANEWDTLIAALPDAHVLQTAEWANSKAQVGWRPHFLVWGKNNQGVLTLHDSQWPSDLSVKAAALILERSISIGGFAARLRILYSPKGPLLNWNDQILRQRVITDLQHYTRRKAAIFLKIDPDVRLSSDSMGKSSDTGQITGNEVQNLLLAQGWRYSAEQIQFRNTVFIDLTLNEVDLLAQMKQKTRYNIRLASRKGVTIRRGSPQDYPLLYRMYAETSLRDGFTIRDESYYHNVWNSFAPLGHQTPTAPVCQSLIAEVDGEAVSALVLFMFAGKAWYFYGMSRELHRDKMPNYLLQWEAIRLSQAAGCLVYDLWGAPDVLDQADPMWGVYRFKEGLGGKLTHSLGAWDYPVQALRYMFYTKTMPRLMNIMRRGGKIKTRQFAG